MSRSQADSARPGSSPVVRRPSLPTSASAGTSSSGSTASAVGTVTGSPLADSIAPDAGAVVAFDAHEAFGNALVLDSLTSGVHAGLPSVLGAELDAGVHGALSEGFTNSAMARALRHAVDSNGVHRGAGELVEDAIKSGGRPLPQQHLQRFEEAFERDLRHVRVHTDGKAQKAAAALSAHAFAMGADVFFGRGAWNPGTQEGDRVLAHELTHVVQHDQGRIPTANGLEVSNPSDSLEREAYGNEQRILRILGAIDGQGPQDTEGAGEQAGPVAAEEHAIDAAGQAQDGPTDAEVAVDETVGEAGVQLAPSPTSFAAASEGSSGAPDLSGGGEPGASGGIGGAEQGAVGGFVFRRSFGSFVSKAKSTSREAAVRARHRGVYSSKEDQRRKGRKRGLGLERKLGGLADKTDNKHLKDLAGKAHNRFGTTATSADRTVDSGKDVVDGFKDLLDGDVSLDKVKDLAGDVRTTAERAKQTWEEGKDAVRTVKGQANQAKEKVEQALGKNGAGRSEPSVAGGSEPSVAKGSGGASGGSEQQSQPSETKHGASTAVKGKPVNEAGAHASTAGAQAVLDGPNDDAETAWTMTAEMSQLTPKGNPEKPSIPERSEADQAAWETQEAAYEAGQVDVMSRTTARFDSPSEPAADAGLPTVGPSGGSEQQAEGDTSGGASQVESGAGEQPKPATDEPSSSLGAGTVIQVTGDGESQLAVVVSADGDTLQAVGIGDPTGATVDVDQEQAEVVESVSVSGAIEVGAIVWYQMFPEAWVKALVLTADGGDYTVLVLHANEGAREASEDELALEVPGGGGGPEYEVGDDVLAAIKKELWLEGTVRKVEEKPADAVVEGADWVPGTSDGMLYEVEVYNVDTAGRLFPSTLLIDNGATDSAVEDESEYEGLSEAEIDELKAQKKRDKELGAKGRARQRAQRGQGGGEDTFIGLAGGLEIGGLDIDGAIGITVGAEGGVAIGATLDVAWGDEAEGGSEGAQGAEGEQASSEASAAVEGEAAEAASSDPAPVPGASTGGQEVSAPSLSGDTPEQVQADFNSRKPTEQAVLWPDLDTAMQGAGEGLTDAIDEAVPEFHAVLAGEEGAEGEQGEVAAPGTEGANEVGAKPEAIEATETEPTEVGGEEGSDFDASALEGFQPAADTPEGQESSSGGENRAAVNQAVGSVDTTADIQTSPGPAPKVPTTGGSDPSQVASEAGKAAAAAAEAQQEAAAAVADAPGSEQVQPLSIDEALDKPTFEAPEIDGTDTLAEMDELLQKNVGNDVLAAFDELAGPDFQDHLAPAKDEVAKAEAEADAKVKAELDKADAEVAKATEAAQAEQDKVVAEQRAKIEGERKKVVSEQQAAVAQFRTELDAERGKQKAAIDAEIAKTNEQVAAKYADAQKEADAKVADAEKQAEAEKKKAEKESESSSWWSRAVDFVASAIDSVVSAISSIFDAVRNAVTQLLDAVKAAATSLIDAAASWIKDQIEAFGSFVKAGINFLLADTFPGLAKRLNEFVDSAVDYAKATVDFVAKKLKDTVESIVNAVGAAITGILNFVQGALSFALNMAKLIIQGDWEGALLLLLEGALQVAGIDKDEFYALVGDTEEVIDFILDNPGEFVSRVIEAFSLGFTQFQDNFLDHLKTGFMDWLFGQVSDSGIKLPNSFDLAGVFSVVVQVIGINRDYLIKKIEKHAGSRAAGVAEQTLEYVDALVEGGFAGLWEEAQSDLGDLYDTVVGGLQTWLYEKIVLNAVLKLASMFNPVGALVQALITAWNVYQFVKETLSKIYAIVEAFVGGLAELVAGNLGGAANKVEQALAGFIPVAINLLAKIANVTGIGKKVREVIEGLQERVDKAIDKVIERMKGLFKGGDKGDPAEEEEDEESANELQLNGNWGTQSPILYRYAAPGEPTDLVLLSAHGTYQLSVRDQAKADVQWKNGERYDNKGLQSVMRSLVHARMAENIAGAHTPVENLLDQSTNKGLGVAATAMLAGELADFGLSVDKVTVQHLGLAKGSSNDNPQGEKKTEEREGPPTEQEQAEARKDDKPSKQSAEEKAEKEKQKKEDDKRRKELKDTIKGIADEFGSYPPQRESDEDGEVDITDDVDLDEDEDIEEILEEEEKTDQQPTEPGQPTEDPSSDGGGGGGGRVTISVGVLFGGGTRTPETKEEPEAPATDATFEVGADVLAAYGQTLWLEGVVEEVVPRTDQVVEGEDWAQGPRDGMAYRVRIWNKDASDRWFSSNLMMANG